MCHSLITCYYVLHKQIPDYTSSKFSFNVSHRQSLIFWLSILGIHFAHTFVINTCSYMKIVLTEPVLMPRVSAIRCTLTRRLRTTIFSTARQFSSQTSSEGHPDWDIQGLFGLNETRQPDQHLRHRQYRNHRFFDNLFASMASKT